MFYPYAEYATIETIKVQKVRSKSKSKSRRSHLKRRVSKPPNYSSVEDLTSTVLEKFDFILNQSLTSDKTPTEATFRTTATGNQRSQEIRKFESP